MAVANDHPVLDLVYTVRLLSLSINCFSIIFMFVTSDELTLLLIMFKHYFLQSLFRLFLLLQYCATLAIGRRPRPEAFAFYRRNTPLATQPPDQDTDMGNYNEHRTQETGFKHQTKDTRQRTQDKRHKVQGTGHRRRQLRKGSCNTSGFLRPPILLPDLVKKSEQIGSYSDTIQKKVPPRGGPLGGKIRQAVFDPSHNWPSNFVAVTLTAARYSDHIPGSWVDEGSTVGNGN